MKFLKKIFSIENEYSGFFKFKNIIILGHKLLTFNISDYTNKILSTQHCFFNKYIDITSIKAKNELKNIQILDTLTLDIVNEIFKKNNIQYWLDFGTLLGSIRHKGFIPWDEDVDIAMMREELNKKIPLIKEKLIGLGFDIEEPISQENIETEFQIYKIRMKNTPINIDIIPYDYYYKKLTTKNDKIQLKKKIDKCRQIYLNNLRNNDFSKKLLELQKEIILDGNIPDNKSMIYCGSDCYIHDLAIQDVDDIFPLKNFYFENLKLPVPNNYDNYLKQLHGEYMNFPKYIIPHDFIFEKLNGCNIDNTKNKLENILAEVKNGKY